MNLRDLRDAIAAHPDRAVLIRLADGRAIAPHFHVTEVGHVTKDFIDCGGTPRTEARCVLQTLVAGDVDHRLTSTKLAGIVGLVDRLGLTDETPVEVEHQERTIATDSVESVVLEGDTLVLRLAPKQTACLAEDACGLPVLCVVDDEGCSGTGCC